jgi:adenylate cyclase
MDPAHFNLILRDGWNENQTKHGTGSLTINQAIETFMSHTRKEDALPSLAVAYTMLSKHSNGLDEATQTPGITERMQMSLIQHYEALV